MCNDCPLVDCIGKNIYVTPSHICAALLLQSVMKSLQIRGTVRDCRPQEGLSYWTLNPDWFDYVPDSLGPLSLRGPLGSSSLSLRCPAADTHLHPTLHQLTLPLSQCRETMWQHPQCFTVFLNSWRQCQNDAHFVHPYCVNYWWACKMASLGAYNHHIM